MQFFKRQRRIDIWFDAFELNFCFFCRAGTDEYDFCVFVRIFYVFCNGRHRRKIVGYFILKLRKLFAYVINKRRAAGACKEALFRQFRRLRVCHHIRTQSSLYTGIETELFQPGNHLSQLCKSKLTGYRRRDHRVNLVLGIVFTFFQYIYGIKYIRLIHYGAERALINTRTAGYTFFIADLRRFGAAHAYRLYLAGILARPLEIGYCAVRTNSRACTAFNAFRFINMRLLVRIKCYCASSANILAAVRNTSATGIGNGIAAHRAFITCNIYNLYHIRVAFVAPHCQLYSFGKNGSFLINTAPH